MSSVLVEDGGRDHDVEEDVTLFWWCRCCGGAVNWQRGSCFCCGADKPDDADRLTREDVEHRARNREQVEEDLRS